MSELPNNTSHDGLIHNPDLAWDVAHAEKPHIEDAMLAIKTGKFALAGTHINNANAASEQVVRQESMSTFERQVDDAKRALVSRYENYGVKPEDFQVVTYTAYLDSRGYTTHDGEERAVVVYSQNEGIDLGEGKNTAFEIFNSDEHAVEIEGEVVQTTQLDYEMYKALVEEVGVDALPDYSGAETLLPGEHYNVDEDRSNPEKCYYFVGSIDEDGSPYKSSRRLYSSEVLFRPAIAISTAS